MVTLTDLQTHTTNNLLTSNNSVLILVDQLCKSRFNHKGDESSLRNNLIGLAKAAKRFHVPVIITDMAANLFNEQLSSEIRALLTDVVEVNRTCMNCWECGSFLRAVERIGPRKLIIAAVWAEVGLVFPALCALEEGYEVYVVEDASAGINSRTHALAIERLIQAGVIPVTWVQVMWEWQRGKEESELAVTVAEIMNDHGGWEERRESNT